MYEVNLTARTDVDDGLALPPAYSRTDRSEMLEIPWIRPKNRSLAAGGLFRINALGQRPRSENEATIRKLCSNAYLGTDTSICRILGRYTAFVDTSDEYISPHLLLDGFWEMWVTEIIPNYIRPGMTVVDVGANLGYYTLLMADLVGPNGRVHAFEPNPPIVDRLRKTVTLNGFSARTEIHTCALSDTDDEVVHLITPPNGPGGAFMHLPIHLPTGEDEKLASNAVEVRTRRLDGLGIAAPGFIKIDAEGAEERIWQGMRRMLEKPGSTTIALEFTACRYSAPAEFLGEITRFGFSLSRVDPTSGLKTATVDQLLSSSPSEDQMLILRR